MTEPYVPAGPPRPEGPFPQDFGRYRLERCLGSGAHGTVYCAFDTTLQTPVALKVPNERARGNPGMLERFYREARAAARLRQESHLCHVLDVGASDGIPYLTMQMIDGRPLPVGAPWEQGEAARLVWKLAGALWKAHSRGVVHRDLKPENILIDEGGEPTITDFGVALLVGPDEIRLTQDGAVLGSWRYMAPEQMEGKLDLAGPACDIYALGVILYELLLGRPPFLGSTLSDLLHLVNNAEPPPPRRLRPDLDACLEAACLRALAKQPADRFDDMRHFANALAAYLGEPQIPEAVPAGRARAPGPQVRADAIHFVFCAVGEAAPPRLRPGYLYLDVGNGLRCGVIDHHHLREAGTCTTCLVLQHANYIDASVPKNRSPDERFTIVLHEEPDMDALGSAFLVREYLTKGSFPAGSNALAEYVARIDAGSLGLTLTHPFALYAAYNQLLSRLLLERWNSQAELWQTMVRAGLDLIEYVLGEVNRTGVALQDVDAFACPRWFRPEDREEINRDDFRRYERKLADPACQARRVCLSLPDGQGGLTGVTALLARDVQNAYDPDHCRFFRDWARSDARRAGAKPGFVGLSVFHTEGRGQRRHCILSVNPESGVTLRGLGDLLDEAEAAKRKSIYGVDDRVEDPVNGTAKPPRPGYGNADPWYDGRGHDYTIVDSPRSGTLLTAEEIERIFLDFGHGTNLEPLF